MRRIILIGLLMLFALGIIIYFQRSNTLRPKADESLPTKTFATIVGKVELTDGRPASGITVSFNGAGVEADGRGYFLLVTSSVSGVLRFADYRPRTAVYYRQASRGGEFYTSPGETYNLGTIRIEPAS